MKFSERDLWLLEFSINSRIFDTVDSPKAFVVLTLRTPVMLMQPLMTSSPVITVQPGEKVPIDGVVEDGVSGILAGDSDESLLAALIRAFGEEGKRIAKTAAQYAAPFSTEGFAEKVEACYLKAIEAHKRG